MTWRVAWSDGNRDFLAIGPRRDDMKVWEIDDEHLVETRLRFPGCTRFFTDVDIVEDYTRVDRKTVFDGYIALPLRRPALT